MKGLASEKLISRIMTGTFDPPAGLHRQAADKSGRLRAWSDHAA